LFISLSTPSQKQAFAGKVSSLSDKRCLAPRVPSVDHAMPQLLSLSILLRHQIPQRQVIHHVLDILDPVLQPVAAAAQAVVLEVKNLETGVQVLDKLVDKKRSLVVAQSNGIASKAGLSKSIL
jgi:hypothetical protein